MSLSTRDKARNFDRLMEALAPKKKKPAKRSTVYEDFKLSMKIKLLTGK